MAKRLTAKRLTAKRLTAKRLTAKRLTAFKVLTFDTYGTLIDWETGIHTALAPLLSRAPLSRDAALEQYAAVESAQQAATPAMIYSELLRPVYETLAGQWGVDASPGEAEAFGNSVKDWPAFADAPAALAALKQHFKMVTLTNCDRESYKASNQRLEIEWDAIYTAQDVGSYKPDHRNFDYLLDHLRADFGFEKGDILHTAQSLFHDHVPATAYGLATAWIDRRKDRDGYGATAPPSGDYRIDFHFDSMAALAAAHREELGE